MAEENKPDETKKKVDEDWKKQAQAEKERMKQAPPEGEQGEPFVPDPSFQTLITSLVTQALIGLGEMPNPMGEGKSQDLDTAKFSIDMIDMLKAKTQGNLEENEQKYLDAVLYDLRLRFVAVASPRKPMGS